MSSGQPQIITSPPTELAIPPVEYPIGFKNASKYWNESSNMADGGYTKWDGYSPRNSSSDFRAIGHSLWTLFFALLGGAIARRFHDTRELAPT